MASLPEPGVRSCRTGVTAQAAQHSSSCPARPVLVYVGSRMQALFAVLVSSEGSCAVGGRWRLHTAAQPALKLCPQTAVLVQVLFGPAFFRRHGLQAVQEAFLDFEGGFEVRVEPEGCQGCWGADLYKGSL